MSKGCLRPLLFSAGAVLLLGLVLLFFYRDTVSLMLVNMRAMGDGATTARTLASPDDLVAYLAAHPESASLVVFDLGRSDADLFFRADTPRATAGLSRLLLLAEYARQVTDGTLPATRRLPPEALDRYHVPGIDRGTYERARSYLHSRSTTASDSIALKDLAAVVLHTKDPAASDLLLHTLSPSHDSPPFSYPGLDPPLPIGGLFLSWMPDTASSTPDERLAFFKALAPDAVAALAYRQADQYLHDTTYRQRVTDQLARRGTDLSLPLQEEMARASFPQGSARTFASFLTRILTDSLHSPAASRLIREHLEEAATDSARALFGTLGLEGGAFPGLISFAGYTQRQAEAPPRLVILLLEDLPTGIFYHLIRTGLDKALFVQLLGDEAFLQRTRNRLLPPPTGPPH